MFDVSEKRIIFIKKTFRKYEQLMMDELTLSFF